MLYVLFCLIFTTVHWQIQYKLDFSDEETKIKEVIQFAQAHAAGGEVEI